ncbi:MAG: tetratricopeptide repeat protein [Bdellovibrionaceae bacterium]|nr:tetratricopeptide repeat protein [Pseudobdellovibrionaceae bacterium]
MKKWLVRGGLSVCCLSILAVGCTRGSSPGVGSKDSLAQKEAEARRQPSFENLIDLGLLYSKANRSREALESYEKAKALKPEHPIPWNNICAEQNKMGRYLEAIVTCGRALELAPSMELAKNNLQAAKVGLKPMAQERLTAVRNGHVTDSQALIDAGMLLYHVERFDDALEIWSRVKRGDTHYANAQNNIASSYIRMRKFDLAEKFLKAALEIQPSNAHFLNNRNWLESERAAR